MNFKSFAGSLPKEVLNGLIVIGFLAALLLTTGIPDGLAEVRFDGIDSRERVFQGNVTWGMTVLDALNAAATAGDITLRFRIDPDRDVTDVMRVDGKQLDGDNIVFFHNNQSIRSDKIHHIPVRPGDRILVKLLP